MTLIEAREAEIEELSMIFQEEAGFSESQAEEAAEDMVINGLSYEEAYGKHIVDLT